SRFADDGGVEARATPGRSGLRDGIGREGRILASLPPPRHLVNVHDVDVHDGRGSLCFASEHRARWAQQVELSPAAKAGRIVIRTAAQPHLGSQRRMANALAPTLRTAPDRFLQ